MISDRPLRIWKRGYMKKLIAIAMLLSMLFFIAGCQYPTESNFIPEEMGVSDDGLWLYKTDLTRCRSDGSGEEPIPLETQLGNEEAELCDWVMNNDSHTLFYCLSSGVGGKKASALFLYNYEKKTSKELIPALTGSVSLKEGERYVFVQTQCERPADGKAYLFDFEGNFVTDATGYEFEGKSGLLQDIKIETESEWRQKLTFRWWYEGFSDETEIVKDPYRYVSDQYTVGGWSYFVSEDGFVVCVDLSTGEKIERQPSPGLMGGELADYRHEVHTVGNTLFLLYFTDSGFTGLQGVLLYAFKGGEARLISDFGGDFVDIYARMEKVLSLSIVDRYGDLRYFSVDDDLRISYEKPPEEPVEPERFVCGEYAFWVEKKSWYEGFTGPQHNCYYLMRQKGAEKPEILQYRFSDDNYLSLHKYFFFDILPV